MIKNMYTKIAAVAVSFVSFFSALTSAYAQTGITNPIIGTLGDDPERAESGEIFVEYFVSIWNSVITVGAIAVLIFFLWGALEWITAGGDSSKIEKARNKIVQSMIGLLILVSSFVIIGFVSQLFFGEEFSILNLTFTPAGGGESGGGGEGLL